MARWQTCACWVLALARNKWSSASSAALAEQEGENHHPGEKDTVTLPVARKTRLPGRVTFLVMPC